MRLPQFIFIFPFQDRTPLCRTPSILVAILMRLRIFGGDPRTGRPLGSVVDLFLIDKSAPVEHNSQAPPGNTTAKEPGQLRRQLREK